MTREEAIKKLTQLKNKFLDEYIDYDGTTSAYDMAIEALEQPEQKKDKWHIPSAYPPNSIVLEEKLDQLDVTPVVHAKWETGRCTNCHTDKPVVIASVIQGYMHRYQGKLNFCPNCGAKMEEEI